MTSQVKSLRNLSMVDSLEGNLLHSMTSNWICFLVCCFTSAKSFLFFLGTFYCKIHRSSSETCVVSRWFTVYTLVNIIISCCLFMILLYETHKQLFFMAGVRYAQPPIGELIFSTPLPFTEWMGVIDA